ncbi:MAG: hypothetical protein LBC67_07735 [Spirochaetales bacterium]|jgi:nucleoid-associated protein YgaU|nr:hypothetical protein [Spirochaetales bacterium]
MKKLILVFLLAILCAAGSFAQSLQDNEYYKKSMEFTRLSEKALSDGDYDAARDYAIKAQENAALSKQYIEAMLLAYRARSSLNAARARINQAERQNIRTRNRELYNSATALYKQASSKFDAKNYEASMEDSRAVLAMLENLEELLGIGAQGPLAAEYEVKLSLKHRDCLWRIAGFDFVYGDPKKWRSLYEANKSKFVNPEDPDLIVPGQILTIPSLQGETRSGRR